MGHNILCDLMYFYQGHPLLTRFAYQSNYSEMELNYNKQLGRCRVISENYYGRFKKYWEVFAKPFAFKLGSIGIYVHSFVPHLLLIKL